MKLLTITDMAPELEHPGFWTQKRLLFLKTIISVCSNQSIHKNDLTRITNHITESMNSLFHIKDKRGELLKYAFTKKEQEEFNDVIEILQNNSWNCVYFQLKNKTERLSITPSNPEAYISLNHLNKIRESFWSGKLDFKKNIKKVLALELLQGSGILPAEYFSNHADQKLLSSPKGFITLPIAPGSSREIHIPISARATLLCEWFKHNSDEYHKLVSYHLSDFKYASLQLYFSGLEAVIYAQLQRKQLPVPLPNSDEINPIVFRYTEQAFKNANQESTIPKLILRTKCSTKNPHNSDNDQHSEEQNQDEESTLLADLDYPAESVEDYLSWGQESLNTIRIIRYQLKKLLTDNRGNFHNGTLKEEQIFPILKNAVKDTLLRTEQRALLNASKIEIIAIKNTINYLKQSKTSLELACIRIHHHLCERHNTLDTCLAEISSIFEKGLLRYPVADLRCLDEEDIELIVSDYILERNQLELKEQTRQEILSNFKRVIRYSKQKLKLFTNIEISETHNKSNLILTRRNHVLGPSEFDRIKVNNSPVLALAFYAGMRAGEIASLTLNDIATKGNELTIYIRRGKTPSARRAIPLHLLAPPKVITMIRDYYDNRLIHYRIYKRKSERNKLPFERMNKIHFLSENDKCDKNTSNSVVRSALLQLKILIGSGADLHLLRHSFASMIFLRWYCCKFPDLIRDLVDRKHWCFSKAGLAGLKTFFGEDPDIPLPDTNITAIIHLIKLMGHKNTDTFFQVYVHSYDTVLEHALQRVHAESDSIDLPSNLITELVPGMRSRASQVKLKSRTATFLAAL